MGTRSTITAKCADGKWRAIYCHWDGYLEGVGAALLTNYDTQEKIETLIAKGDHSILEKERSLSYFEMRADPVQITEADTYKECREIRDFEEFDYIWNGIRWSEVNNPDWNAS
jgi:hypothetical protein